MTNFMVEGYVFGAPMAIGAGVVDRFIERISPASKKLQAFCSVGLWQNFKPVSEFRILIHLGTLFEFRGL